MGVGSWPPTDTPKAAQDHYLPVELLFSKSRISVINATMALNLKYQQVISRQIATINKIIPIVIKTFSTSAPFVFEELQWTAFVLRDAKSRFSVRCYEKQAQFCARSELIPAVVSLGALGGS